MANVNRHLPVWVVVKRSSGYVWENRSRLLLPLCIVLLWYLVILFAEAPFLPRPTDDSLPSVVSLLTNLAASVAELVIAAAFAVGVHRMVLLGEVRDGFNFLRWDADFRRYFWIAFTLLLLSVGPVMVLASAPVLDLADEIGTPAYLALALAVIAWVVWAILSIRLTLALPAAALGYIHCFKLSWRATQQNLWRLLAVTAIVGLPIGIIEATVVAIADAVLGTHFGSAAGSSTAIHLALVRLPDITVSAVAAAISEAIYIASLSFSYDFLVRGSGQALSQGNIGVFND